MARQSDDVTHEVISNFLKGLIPSFLSLDVDGRVIRIDTYVSCVEATYAR